jgi:hypothetical protein
VIAVWVAGTNVEREGLTSLNEAELSQKALGREGRERRLASRFLLRVHWISLGGRTSTDTRFLNWIRFRGIIGNDTCL